jgi:hypothetical protein
VIDISDPLSPRIAGSIYEGGELAVSGDYVYVAQGSSGLGILPLQCDQSTPVLLRGFSLQPAPGAVTISWQVAADGEPFHFRLLGSNGDREWEVPFTADAAGATYTAVDRSDWLGAGSEIGYRLFLSSDGRSWSLLDSASTSLPASAAATRIVSVYPNPLNPRTTIAFAVRKAESIRLAIYDAAGRRVAVIQDGWTGAGIQEAHWDGCDDFGRSAAAGQYFARLEAGGQVDVQKILLVR